MSDSERQASLSCPEAERKIVGALLICGEIGRVGNLLPAHFSDPVCAAVFTAQRNLHAAGQQIDEVSVTDELRRTKKLDLVGGATAVSTLTAEVITVQGVEQHAALVLQYGAVRQVMAVARVIAKRDVQDADAQSMLSFLSGAVRTAEAMVLAQQDAGGQDLIWTMADVADELKAIRFLWPGWIPQGFLCLLAGIDGIGKSKLALRFAASVVRGEQWPDGAPYVQGEGMNPEIMLVDTESSHGINRERLDALCIPLDRVNWIRHPTLPNEKMPHLMLDDPLVMARHEAVVTARRPALVILDALRGLFKGSENDSQDVLLLAKLAALSLRTGTTHLVIHHLNKAKEQDRSGIVDLDRIRGSTAIRQYCRCIMALDKPDPVTGAVRLRLLKLNIAALPEGLGVYHDGAQLAFTRDAPHEPHRESTAEQAWEFLQQALAAGPVAVRDLRPMVEEAGHTWSSALRARREFAIIRTPKGNDAGQRGVSGWFWSLPTSRTDDDMTGDGANDPDARSRKDTD